MIQVLDTARQAKNHVIPATAGIQSSLMSTTWDHLTPQVFDWIPAVAGMTVITVFWVLLVEFLRQLWGQAALA